MANYNSFRENLMRKSRSMNTYANLPLAQRRTQQIANEFNAAEELWQRVEAERLARRACYSKIPPELHQLLDLLDFATAQAPKDCIGFFIDS
jgi:hypothetical protein